jgi:hypothetical protein
MDDFIVNCIHTKQIDSFQKLHFLLFLHQHPKFQGTCQEFAERLHLGDILLVEGIIADLLSVGMSACEKNYYLLSDDPDVRSIVRSLAQAFEDPLNRQVMLDQVR